MRFRVIPDRIFAAKLERERFSGGVNLSAQERNRERLAEERKRVYVMRSEGVIFCAPRLAAEIERLQDQVERDVEAERNAKPEPFYVIPGSVLVAPTPDLVERVAREAQSSAVRAIDARIAAVLRGEPDPGKRLPRSFPYPVRGAR